MVERVCQRAKSSVQKNERVRDDESFDSEDELPCVIGGEREGDSSLSEWAREVRWGVDSNGIRCSVLKRAISVVVGVWSITTPS